MSHKLSEHGPRGGKRAEKTQTKSSEENKNGKRASEERSGPKSKLPRGMAEMTGYPPGGVRVKCAPAFSTDFKEIGVFA